MVRMTRSDYLALACLVSVLVAVLLGHLPGEALLTLVVGLGITSPLAARP